MRRIVIHVGLPKTGTTSLQVGLRNVQGIRYINDPDLDLPQSRQFANAVGIGRDALAKSERMTWREAFVRSVQETAVPVVISDEILSQVSRIDWQILKDMLSRVDGEIRIVLVLRPFFSWMESLFNQFAKKGRANILSFDPDTDNRLNGYDIDFEAIYTGYTNLAEQLGDRCTVHVLHYSREVNNEICAQIGISPRFLDKVPALNPSPSGHDAVLSFIELNNSDSQDSDLIPGKLHFLGHSEVDKLHLCHEPWIKRLAEHLNWPRTMLDDYETFRASSSSKSLLQSLREIVPASSSKQANEGKTLAMTKNATKNKINGALARALLRMELKMERQEKLSKDEFQAAWTERREEMLTKAGFVRQTLGRMGYDLTERVQEDSDTEVQS